jgi:flagellar biosynthesis component FlhA
MKSLKSSSIFTANNSVVLIIFVFIFIAVGMFFLIQKTTEKEKQNKVDERNKKIEEKNVENVEVRNDSKSSGIANINNMDNASHETFNTDYNTVTETFSDEVGLFIKKDETRPEIYSHNPVYIPPFNTGKETRCVTRQVNRPNETNSVQSCLNSDLVKVSSDASY